MSTADSVEQFRLSRIDRVESELAQRAEKLRELWREIEKLDAAEIPLLQRLTRARQFAPSSGDCPRCAIDDGVKQRLDPIPFGTIVIDQVQQNAVLMQCSRCRWDDTVAHD